jgi:integrase
MARERKPLTVVGLRALKSPGRYSDPAARGLYFLIRPDGRKGWVFRYRDRTTQKQRDKGLGSYPDVGLERAREVAADMRASLRDGADPIDSAKGIRKAARVAAAQAKTFGDCADRYIAAHKPAWQNVKHAAQWRSTLDTYAAELLPLPVADVDTTAVRRALDPIWTTKTETATRVRQRIEAVIDWATAHGYRKGDNPARWRGHLSKLLPPPAKLKKVQNRPALPYAEMHRFTTTLAQTPTLAAQALSLQILCALRPSEAVGARWEEFDLEAGDWTIPAERMKARRPHVVPLPPRLLAFLKKLPRDPSGFLFPGKPGRPITTAATLKLLQTHEPDLSAHGFRSSFRDWAADQTNYPREVAEAALAHVNKDKTEAAYFRSNLLERRRALMADWEAHCFTAPLAGNVSGIGEARAKKRAS